MTPPELDPRDVDLEADPSRPITRPGPERPAICPERSGFAVSPGNSPSAATVVMVLLHGIRGLEHLARRCASLRWEAAPKFVEISGRLRVASGDAGCESPKRSLNDQVYFGPGVRH